MYESMTREIDPTVAAAATVIFMGTTLLLIIGVLAQARRHTSDG
jgi:ABC-type spermidine/putrescine transport system permease subunit II